MKKMFGKGEDKKAPSDDDLFDGIAPVHARRAPARGKEPQAKGRPARPAPAPAPPSGDPWGELEGELSRRIEKAPVKGMSVGTRLAEKAKERPKREPPREIARQEVRDLKEISAKLDQKIVESGLFKIPTVEGNVYAVLGIDVDEADLPTDAEQLLILSVRLMRAAKGFTLGKKLREALFCYQKASVLFDRILEIDPGRGTTRDMKALVQRFITILQKRT